MADPRMDPTVTRTAENRYAVSGPLTFATARRALQAGLDAFSGATGPIDVDFAGVGAADSAGLAVLIEWLAWARRSRRELRYSGLPPAIRAVARISEIEGLLLRR